jgi:hypothetical protein
MDPSARHASHLVAGAHGRAGAPVASRRRTSSSLVGPKFSYHSPTEWKGSGAEAHHFVHLRPQLGAGGGGATGTAMTRRRGPWVRPTAGPRRAWWTRWRDHRPPESPSSRRPRVGSAPRGMRAPGGRARPPRPPPPRRCRAVRNAERLDDVLAEDPHAAAGDGTHRQLLVPRHPSLRTRIASSGAARRRATSAATVTPPRGSAKTSTRGRRRTVERLGEPAPSVHPVPESFSRHGPSSPHGYSRVPAADVSTLTGCGHEPPRVTFSS